MTHITRNLLTGTGCYVLGTLLGRGEQWAREIFPEEVMAHVALKDGQSCSGKRRTFLVISAAQFPYVRCGVEMLGLVKKAEGITNHLGGYTESLDFILKQMGGNY